MIAKSNVTKIKRISFTAVLTIFGFISLLPLIWMVMTSFKTEREALALIPTIFPKNFTLNNYIKLFDELNFLLYFKNTITVVAFSMLGILINALCGYAFALYDFKGKGMLFTLVLITMMIPSQVTMIPVYLMLNSVNLTNNLFGFALPTLVSGFSIFMYRQFMSSIPIEIIEASRIDGCSEFGIFLKMALPIIKSALSIQIILTFIGAWNSFLWPLILANNNNKYTLSVALNLLKGQYDAEYALQMAGATVMIIPIIIVFSLFQKNIINGNTISGIK